MARDVKKETREASFFHVQGADASVLSAAPSGALGAFAQLTMTSLPLTLREPIKV